MHRDEIWHVQFSHSGLLLASASKDATAQIWRISPSGEAVHMHTLAGHEKAVAFLTWSPDDSRLLTCGSDHEVDIHPCTVTFGDTSPAQALPLLVTRLHLL